MEYKRLLNSISALTRKYDEIAKITGENFNIFSILKLESNEVKTHSAFLGELLNPKGSHGLGDIPLKLFISYIEKNIGENEHKDKFHLITEESKVIIEDYQGIINEKRDKGGRIDIVIKDIKGNVIVIENKIYASEGENQLFRYHKAYPKAPILFLTLDGKDAESGKKLTINEHYFLISYNEDIIKWLELCVKEAVYYPMLREVLNQYINLIKKLTNQTINQKMKKEIVNDMSQNVTASFEIANNIYYLKEHLFLAFMEAIEKECENANKNYIFEKEWNKDKDYGFFITIQNKRVVRFLFAKGNFEGFYHGIENNDGSIELTNYIKTEDLLWNWWEIGNNPEFWADISLNENGKTFKKVFEIVEKLSLV